MTGVPGRHAAQGAGILGAAQRGRNEVLAKQVDGSIALCSQRIGRAPSHPGAPIGQASVQRAKRGAMLTFAKERHRFGADSEVVMPREVAQAPP